MSIQQLLESMAERVSASASGRNVYGEPVVVGNRTVIPAAKLRYAFGAGAGKGKDSSETLGGGGGGRVFAEPCGALEVTPEGARFIHFDDRRTAGIALLLGFVLGAAIAASTRTRRIEVVKRRE